MSKTPPKNSAFSGAPYEQFCKFFPGNLSARAGERPQTAKERPEARIKTRPLASATASSRKIGRAAA